MKYDLATNEGVINLSRSLFSSRGATRTALERLWYRNVLYYMGEQWIVWSKSNKGFVPRYRTRKNIPTPVDNIIRDHVRSIKAMILNKDFDITVWPNSNDRDDRNASVLGEDLLADINARDDFINKDIEEDVALWMIMTGTGFIRDYASKEKGQILDVGADTITRIGDVVSENIIAYNIFVDDTVGTRLRDKRYFGLQSLKDKDWIKERFHDFKNDAASDIQMVNYQQTLARMVSSVSPFKSAGQDGLNAGSQHEDAEDMTMYREIEFAPSIKFPKGRHVILAGDQILHIKDELPIEVDDSGGWNYTVEDFRIIPVPGRFWGESSINDLISPQNSINQIDQALIKNRRSLGRPMVISPVGVKLKKKSAADAAILQLEYDPVASKGNTPTLHHGIPLPTDTLNERAIQKEVAQDTSGDPKGVLRGKAPSSSSSGVMVDILRETAEQGHAPDVNRFFRALQRSYRKRLIIAQKLYTEKRMLKVAGSDGKVSVKHFVGSDLRGNTDVRLELVSGMSSTNAGRVQMMKDLILAGVFNEQVIPPDIREELLRKMKVSGFKNKMAADQKRAEEENSQCANGEIDFFLEQQMVDDNGNPLPLLVEQPPGSGDMQPVIDPETKQPQMILDEKGQPPWVTVKDDPIFDLDDHQIHSEFHRRFIISPEFSELKENVRIVFIGHYEAHVRRIVEDMQAEQEIESRRMMAESRAKREEKRPFLEPPQPGQGQNRPMPNRTL